MNSDMLSDVIATKSPLMLKVFVLTLAFLKVLKSGAPPSFVVVVVKLRPPDCFSKTLCKEFQASLLYALYVCRNTYQRMWQFIISVEGGLGCLLWGWLVKAWKFCIQPFSAGSARSTSIYEQKYKTAFFRICPKQYRFCTNHAHCFNSAVSKWAPSNSARGSRGLGMCIVAALLQFPASQIRFLVLACYNYFCTLILHAYKPNPVQNPLKPIELN